MRESTCRSAALQQRSNAGIHDDEIMYEMHNITLRCCLHWPASHDWQAGRARFMWFNSTVAWDCAALRKHSLFSAERSISSVIHHLSMQKAERSNRPIVCRWLQRLQPDAALSTSASCSSVQLPLVRRSCAPRSRMIIPVRCFTCGKVRRTVLPLCRLVALAHYSFSCVFHLHASR